MKSKYNPITYTQNQFRGKANELAAAIGVYMIYPYATPHAKNEPMMDIEDKCESWIYSICNSYKHNFDLESYKLFTVIRESLFNIEYNKVERLIKRRLRNYSLATDISVKYYMPVIFMMTQSYAVYLAKYLSCTDYCVGRRKTVPRVEAKKALAKLKSKYMLMIGE